MSGVVNPWYQAEKQVVGGEHDQASESGLQRFLRERKFSQVQDGDQPTGQSKDRSRCSRSGSLRVPPQTGQAAGDPAGGVNQQITPAIKDPLGQQAQVPQTPHVEKNVDDPDVNIVRRKHPPGL
jgi:hypothetical protein